MMRYARCLRVVLVRDRGSDLSNGGFCVLKHVEVNVRLKEQLEWRRGPSEFDVIVQDRIQVADILGSCFLIVMSAHDDASEPQGHSLTIDISQTAHSMHLSSIHLYMVR